VYPSPNWRRRKQGFPRLSNKRGNSADGESL
jgi:hypothetical protein